VGECQEVAHLLGAAPLEEQAPYLVRWYNGMRVPGSLWGHSKVVMYREGFVFFLVAEDEEETLREWGFSPSERFDAGGVIYWRCAFREGGVVPIFTWDNETLKEWGRCDIYGDL